MTPNNHTKIIAAVFLLSKFHMIYFPLNWNISVPFCADRSITLVWIDGQIIYMICSAFVSYCGKPEKSQY
jgi:hypothetical protein